AYTCVYQKKGAVNPKDRVTETYGPIQVRTVKQLPVAGGLGLAALALATALGGLAAVRRRK
ncbi:MAG: hypothetical protein GX580_07940, partial [Candidatus Hydrogenedens sp.]|nr:hypothetical protein [Candidatus Hydrogenedens sp.]